VRRIEHLFQRGFSTPRGFIRAIISRLLSLVHRNSISLTTDSAKLKVSKLDAARRQLECAIELWFLEKDEVSVHTLAGAAYQIIHDINTHIHPDSKFLSAEYFDQGVTQRRHVFTANIHHIGKEADNLEEQLELGFDPDAVLDYGIGFEGARLTLGQVRIELRKTNLNRLSIASGVSRQRLTDIRDGKKTPKRVTLKKIAAGLQRLAAEDRARQAELDALLTRARAERDRLGLREFARRLKYDHSTVARVLDGHSAPSAQLLEKLTLLLES
jgi:transcriptional regulator with XRE-family HTH domain